MRFFLKHGIPPLLPLSLSLCAGITAANYLQLSPKLLISTASAILAFLSIFIVVKSRSLFSILVPVFFVTFCFVYGYYIFYSALYPYLPENHISHFIDKGILKITGRISSEPEKFSYDSSASGKKRVRFNLETLNVVVREKGVSKRTTGMVQINVYNPLKEYKQGDIIEFQGKIKSFRNFNNPGGFDYVRYMRLNNIWGRGGINCRSVTLVKLQNTTLYNIKEPDRGWFDISAMALLTAKIDNFRREFIDHIFSNIKQRDSGAVICALTTGNRDFITDELTRDFSRTGGAHILAISGLHLSIVATLFFYLFNAFLSCSEWVVIRGWSKKGAALLTLLPIVAYAALSGYSDATKRAVAMVCIFMMSAVVEREFHSFNSLSAAGIVVLLFDPLSLFMASFQLSFSAVMFILMGLSLTGQYRSQIKASGRRSADDKVSCAAKMRYWFSCLVRITVCRKIVSFLFVSFCAIAGTQILVMRYFHICSFSGLFVNMVIIPGIGFCALPLGLSSLFLFPFSPQISGFIMQLAGVIVTPSIAFIRAIAALNWSYTETFTPDILEILCYYIFCVSIFITAKYWIRDIAGGGTTLSGQKPNKISLRGGGILAILPSLVVALACLTFIIYEALWIKERLFNKKINVTILDVGEGNSAFIEMPEGKNILVDGGGFSYGGKFDTGKDIVAPFLRQKRVMTLDAVVLTHPDSDHINGLVYIVNHFRVKLLIKNCDQQDSQAYKDLMSGAKRGGVRIYTVDDMARPIKIGQGEFCFFHPLKRCSSEEVTDFNNNSLVFKIIFKQSTLLFPGDIMAKAEREIAYKHGAALKSDILIAPHHGSSSSTTDFFLDAVAPKSVIISCGWQNRFGFPGNIVLKRCQKRGIEIFRTDLNGAVNLCSSGDKWKITALLR